MILTSWRLSRKHSFSGEKILCPEIRTGQVISNTTKQIFQGKEKLK